VRKRHSAGRDPAAFTGAPFREELRSRDDIADDFRCVRDE
jgi:hypothetical protein